MSELSAVFEHLGMEELVPETFDARVLSADQKIKAVFFWGHQCPNCEIAKRSMSENHQDLLQLGFSWFHVNTYHHFELGTRFGLHGIPTFLFFFEGRKLGRISPYPGIEPFLEALKKLRSEWLPPEADS